jgi:hypothetical protein
MRRASRNRTQALLAAVLLALVLPLTACEPKDFTVQLPGFGDGAIDGIWLWRQAPTGGYERMCRIDFLGVGPFHGMEGLTYIQGECVHEQPGMEMWAKIERPPSNPTTVTVRLWYLRWEDEGRYKASAFNASGESGLSASSVDL